MFRIAIVILAVIGLIATCTMVLTREGKSQPTPMGLGDQRGFQNPGDRCQCSMFL
jgi:hypothetical protein